jgi:signal transduction histidine kinase/CheY-like chemotaxis protein
LAAALAIPTGHVHARAGTTEPPRASSAVIGSEGIGQTDSDLEHALAQARPASEGKACGAVPADSAVDPGWKGGYQSPTIPSDVFWLQIFPGMLLLLATAVGVSFGYVQLRREVMRRRAAEVRLETARDLADSAMLSKSTFFATMSHEIRTPLSGIIGMLELLKRGAMVAEQRQMLLAVDTAANSMLQILDQVMDFTKVEANRMSLESTPVDLRAMVQSVVMVMGEPARRRGVRTTYQVDGAVCAEILGDPLRIRQILTNLISNAAKFTAQGEVRLTVHAEEATRDHQLLRFVITDTGIGIPADKLAQVMMPFRQADTSTTRQYGGTGLGLPVSSRLARLMGGRLTLSSVPGDGTRAEFSCRFPVHRANAPGAQASAPASAPASTPASTPTSTGLLAATPVLEGAGAHALESVGPHAVKAVGTSAGDMAARQGRDAPQSVAGLTTRPATGLTTGLTTRPTTGPTAGVSAREAWAAPVSLGPARILVVDDHEINRDLMRRQLTALGYACDVLADGPAALAALQAGDYAMLLTDCQMPAMSGEQLASAWREREQRDGVPVDARLPIVIVTAKAASEKPLSPNVDARLRKPVQLEMLRKVLQDALAGSKAAPRRAMPEPVHESSTEDGGLALSTLREQFAGNDDGLRQFLRASVGALRADLAQADRMPAQFAVPADPQHAERMAAWLHRAVGALGMLGHWPVVDEGSVLEDALQRPGGAQALAELPGFLRRFADAIDDIDRHIDRL